MQHTEWKRVEADGERRLINGYGESATVVALSPEGTMLEIIDGETYYPSGMYQIPLSDLAWLLGRDTLGG